MKTTKIKEIIGETLRESTTHGIPYIAKRQHWALRILWVLCFLGSAGYCVNQMMKNINDFLQNETVTKTEVVDEIPSLYPTITICNINMFVTNVSQSFVSDVLSKNQITALNFSYFLSNDFMFMKYFVGKNAFDASVSTSLKQQFGFKLEDTLLSCLFNLSPCNADDFEWYFDPFYGNCYKFNSGRNSSGHSVPDKITTNAGKINGLLLEILVGEPNDMKSLGVSSGLHVLIHNKSVQPSFFNGVDVATGTQTNIGIERTFVSKLSDPFSDCTDKIDSERYPLLDLIQTSNNSYSQSLCFNFCFQNYLIQNCGCYDPSISKWYNTTRSCLSYNDTICSSRMLNI